MALRPRNYEQMLATPERDLPMIALVCPRCSHRFETIDWPGVDYAGADALCLACTTWDASEEATTRVKTRALGDGIATLLRKGGVPRSLIASRADVEAETGPWALHTGLSPMLKSDMLLLLGQPAGVSAASAALSPSRCAVAWAGWRAGDSGGRLAPTYVRLDDWLFELETAARSRATSDAERSPLAIFKVAARAQLLIADAFGVVARRMKEHGPEAMWARHIVRLVRQRVDDRLPTVFVWDGSLEECESVLPALGDEVSGRLGRELVTRAVVRRS